MSLESNAPSKTGRTLNNTVWDKPVLVSMDDLKGSNKFQTHVHSPTREYVESADAPRIKGLWGAIRYGFLNLGDSSFNYSSNHNPTPLVPKVVDLVTFGTRWCLPNGAWGVPQIVRYETVAFSIGLSGFHVFDPNYLLVFEKIVSDFHGDDALALDKLARRPGVIVKQLVAHETSVTKADMYNASFLTKPNPKSRDRADLAALRNVVLRRPSQDIENLFLGLDLKDHRTPRITLLIMGPVAIDALEPEDFSGYVVFFGVDGYNTQFSTYMNERLELGDLLYLIQKKCVQNGGFLLVINTQLSFGCTRQTANANMPTKIGSRFFQNVELGDWVVDNFKGISSHFFETMANVCYKLTGRLEETKVNEQQQASVSARGVLDLQSCPEVVRLGCLYISSCAGVPCDEKDMYGKKMEEWNQNDQELAKYIFSTLEGGVLSTGKYKEFTNFLYDPEFEYTDAACMELLLHPEMFELLPYHYSPHSKHLKLGGAPKEPGGQVSALGDTRVWSRNFESYEECVNHVGEYGLLISLKQDCIVRFQGLIESGFAALKADSERAMKTFVHPNFPSTSNKRRKLDN